MKTSFAGFWRRSLGCARLAVLSQLEYRFNLLTDVIVQPVATAAVEIVLWSAIFASATAGGATTLGGFTLEYYLSYALWAAFFGRISASWLYEFRMIEEIESGTVNSVLARPISFYEYYLAQLMGYKVLTTVFSLSVPVVISVFLKGSTILSRLPLTLALVFFGLLFVHTISFAVSSFGFFFNRVRAFTYAKNIMLWGLSGELFPLDLVPEPYRSWVIALPFSSFVYIPVGYLTGRLEIGSVLNGFFSVTCGLLIMGVLSTLLWRAGNRRYSGTGA